MAKLFSLILPFELKYPKVDKYSIAYPSLEQKLDGLITSSSNATKANKKLDDDYYDPLTMKAKTTL